MDLPLLGLYELGLLISILLKVVQPTAWLPLPLDGNANYPTPVCGIIGSMM